MEIASDADGGSGLPDVPARQHRRVRGWLRRQPRWCRVVLRVVLAVVMVPTLLIGVLGAALFAEGSGTPSRDAHSTGHDALWLGHSWVGWDPAEERSGKTAETDADFQALAGRIRDSGIKDLFVHAGPFAYDGTLDLGLSPRAEWFVSEVHRELPGVRVEAWLGQVVGEGGLDVDSPAVRERVVTGVAAMLSRGFDGVHFDFEPVQDGDQQFLSLLEQTHQLTAAHGALLSISVPQLAPIAGWQAPGDLLIGHDKWWTTGYLRAIADHVDQVAVMAYDTALPTAWAFRGYVARQTELALETVPKNVGLLIGVPAYDEENMSHHGFAETMPAAVRGVRLGMGGDVLDRDFGVALYVDFTATDADWEAYRQGWVRPGG